MLRNTTRWLVSGLWLAMAMLAIVAAMLATSVIRTIFFAIDAAPLILLGVRGARSAIWINDIGVIARADRFTRHLAWSEIDRFELRLRRYLGLVPRQGLGAWRRNGQWVHLMDHGMDSKNRYSAALQVLQAEAARRQQP